MKVRDVSNELLDAGTTAQIEMLIREAEAQALERLFKLRPQVDVWERIRERCAPDGDCLVYQGSTTRAGYAGLRVAGRRQLVHRVVYEYFHGPIPAGLQIDHVKARGCHSRACCNPAHLEAVTPRVNVLRSTSFAAMYAQQTHCLRGHEYNAVHARLYRGRRVGRRVCLTCKIVWNRAYRRRAPLPSAEVQRDAVAS